MTGLGFVLVLVGPIVLLYGPLEGVTIGVLLALVASLTAIPLVWRHIEWSRTWWLIWPGLIAAPFGALLVRVLPDAALLLLIAAMAYFALVAGWIPALAASLRGRPGAVVAGSAAGFMHVASGLSGPPLAAYAVGDHWPQRRFAASVQVIFATFSVVSVALRGLPATPVDDVWLLIAATAGGIAIGTILSRHVAPRIARIAMLALAWAGATVVLVRGILALWS
ncbi:hypothetical protein OB08_10710 [Microbacterium sp. HJ5]